MKALKLTDLDGLPRIVVISGHAVIDPIESPEDPGPWDENQVHTLYAKEVARGRVFAPEGWSPGSAAPKEYLDWQHDEWQEQSNAATVRARISFFTGKKRWNVLVRESFEEIQRQLMGVE